MSPIEHLVDAFPQDIRFVYRHFPLNGDPQSANQLLAKAAEAAGEQGQFFEYQALLMERQEEVRVAFNDGKPLEKVVEYAAELGLDTDSFTSFIESDEAAERVAGFYTHAVSLGLQGTPSFFLNGQPFNPQAFLAPEEQWAAFLEAERLMQALPTYEKPEMTIDPSNSYQAVVETEKGSFVIELFAEQTPVTVNNFIFLANEGWYNDVTFHRVLVDFMAQTGDPTGTGMGGPGYVFEDEIVDGLNFDDEGLVAMANSGANTNGSQWFITFAATEHLNGMHTIFGRVIEGMDVVNSLTLRDPTANPDFDGDRILKITIEES